MEILRSISSYAQKGGLRFLVIGGHAVNYYGISRQTADLDLLISSSQKNQWSELILNLDYQQSQDDDRFVRFTPNALAAWPIDLMLVDENTFDKLWSNSIKSLIGSASVQIVSPRHLATLKIHALKHYQEHRFAKDYNDLVMLIKSKKTLLSEDEIKELCQHYASLELFDKLKREM